MKAVFQVKAKDTGGKLEQKSRLLNADMNR